MAQTNIDLYDNFYKALLSLILLFSALFIFLTSCAAAGKGKEELRDFDDTALLRMGERLEMAGDYVSALQFYKEATERMPTSPEPWLGMGQVYSKGGAALLATQAFGEAYARDPNNGQAAIQYAKGLLSQEKVADALSVLTQHMKKNEGDAEMYNLIGIAYDLNLNAKAAEDAYLEGLKKTKLNSSWSDALTSNLALSLAVNDRVSEAVELLEPISGELRASQKELTTSQLQHRQNLALIYALSGRPALALELIKITLGDAEIEKNRAFYAFLPSLTGYERARAVFLGKLPPTKKSQ